MATAARKRTIRIGPLDDGHPMALSDFGRAIGEEGYRYELHAGVIEVSSIPDFLQAMTLDDLREQLSAYRRAHPQRIKLIGGGGEAKVTIDATESERHPDLSVYCSAPPAPARQPWDTWIPEIVVEVVSASSRKRDYDIKPAEYLTFGIKEYWIIDPEKQHAVIHSRVGGRFISKTLKAQQKYESHILPDFKLDLKRLLLSAK